LSYNAISFAGIAPNDAKLFDRRAAPAQAEAAMRSWGHVHAAWSVRVCLPGLIRTAPRILCNHNPKKGDAMKTSATTLLAALLCGLLGACASTGTRVSSTSDMYKETAKTQQAWCSQLGCSCSIDGVPASCSLVSACLNSGNCQRAAQ